VASTLNPIFMLGGAPEAYEVSSENLLQKTIDTPKQTVQNPAVRVSRNWAFGRSSGWPDNAPRAFRRPSRQPALPKYGVCATARNCRQHGCPEGHAASSALATQSFPNKFPWRRLPTF